jgi:hypothetical protein
LVLSHLLDFEEAAAVWYKSTIVVGWLLLLHRLLFVVVAGFDIAGFQRYEVAIERGFDV